MSSLITASASSFASHDQFEALRSVLFDRFGLIQLVKADHCEGRMDWAFSMARGPTGSFGSFRGDAIQAQRPSRSNPASDDAIILTWMRNGRIVQEAPCGAQTEITGGGLCVYDSAQSMRFHRSAMHGLNLVLPRHSVMSALGGRSPANGALPLPQTSLAPFLFAQLDLLERLGPTLPPASLATALDATVQLALSCLREAVDLPAHSQECAQPHQGLLAAARQYMRAHLHLHDLDAGRIAAAVHSSRARLYRAFAEQDSSVIAELREMRLQFARQQLESSHEAIGALAWSNGFSSASVFSRMFRERFGCSAQEWRAQHRKR